MAAVTYQLESRVATVTMDDGKVNVISTAMVQALNEALDRAVADRAAVILAGRAGTFSAGFDLPTMAKGGEPAIEMLKGGFELAERLLSFPAPLVVACGGHALAMGVFLLLAGDYRVGADGAFKVGANEVAVGLTMPRFGVEMCRQRLAPAHFHRAVINAEIYAPADAVAAGFFDRVVAPDQVMAEAQAAMGKLVALNRGTHTATKLRAREAALKAIRAAIDADLAEFRSMLRAA